MCTDCFTLKEVEHLIEVLNNKFNLSCYKCKNDNNYRIIIPSYSIPLLRQLVSAQAAELALPSLLGAAIFNSAGTQWNHDANLHGPHIPTMMRHKLGRSIEFSLIISLYSHPRESGLVSFHRYLL